jgi:hypothetical protein
MNFNDIDLKRIRKCELIQNGNMNLIQFIATGDRHKMMKNENGEIEIIKLYEQGRDYRYGDPLPVEDGLKLLDMGAFPTHKHIAMQIRSHINSING